jgi:hypothetical protein
MNPVCGLLVRLSAPTCVDRLSASYWIATGLARSTLWLVTRKSLSNVRVTSPGMAPLHTEAVDSGPS